MHFFFFPIPFLLSRYCKIYKQQYLSNDSILIDSILIGFTPNDSSPIDFSPIDFILFPILLPFSLSPDLLLLVTDRQAMSKKSSRACTHTHLPTGFLIFCCHKCHTKSIFTTIFHSFPLPLLPTYPSFSFLQNHSPKRHFEQFHPL